MTSDANSGVGAGARLPGTHGVVRQEDIGFILERCVRDERLQPGACIVWRFRLNASGYGNCRRRGVSMLVHRVAYEAVRGPIPPGMQIDHLCRNRACVNPNHLEVVTNKVNVRRGFAPSGINHRMTKCAKGLHELSGANLYRAPDGHRLCRACNAEYRRRNADAYRESARRSRERNRKKAAERSRAYYIRNRDLALAKARDYYRKKKAGS